jgi:hypothetical protein
MLDLHEGVAAIFAEASRSDVMDYDHLRFDSPTARNLTFEASYIAEARLAEGITRWSCASCGQEVELRPGFKRPIHMGSVRDWGEACRRLNDQRRDVQETRQ